MFKVGDVVVIVNLSQFENIKYKIIEFSENNIVARLCELKNNNIERFHVGYLKLDQNYIRKQKLKKLCSK